MKSEFNEGIGMTLITQIYDCEKAVYENASKCNLTTGFKPNMLNFPTADLIVSIYPASHVTGICIDPLHTSKRLLLSVRSVVSVSANEHYKTIWDLLIKLLKSFTCSAIIFGTPVFDLWETPDDFYTDAWSHFCTLVHNSLQKTTERFESAVVRSLDFRKRKTSAFSSVSKADEVCESNNAAVLAMSLIEGKVHEFDMAECEVFDKVY